MHLPPSRATAVACTTALAVAVAAPAAAAHTAPTAPRPADRAAPGTGPRSLPPQFTDPVRTPYSRPAVTGPSQQQIGAEGLGVARAIDPYSGPMAYTLGVVPAAGQPIAVAGPSSPTAAGPAAGLMAPLQSEVPAPTRRAAGGRVQPSRSSTPVWQWAVLIALCVLLVVGGFAWVWAAGRKP